MIPGSAVTGKQESITQAARMPREGLTNRAPRGRPGTRSDLHTKKQRRRGYVSDAQPVEERLAGDEPLNSPVTQ